MCLNSEGSTESSRYQCNSYIISQRAAMESVFPLRMSPSAQTSLPENLGQIFHYFARLFRKKITWCTIGFIFVKDSIAMWHDPK